MNPTTRFSDRAAAYAANRPGYSSAVFDALLERLDASTITAADIGAGTGISSNALAERVAHVIAIEPNESMRAKAVPRENVEWRAGTGEKTGLPDKSVDLAAAFQAFHWFDVPKAYAEFERIARKRIALVQYERDEREAFAAAFGSLVREYMTDDTEALRMRTLDAFAHLAGSALHRHAVPGSQELDNVSLVGRIDSASYLPHSGPQADELRSRARGLFAEFAEGGTVSLAMTTHVLYVDVG